MDKRPAVEGTDFDRMAIDREMLREVRQDRETAKALAAALDAYVKAQSRMLEKWSHADPFSRQRLWRDLHACEEAGRAALSAARGEIV